MRDCTIPELKSNVDSVIHSSIEPSTDFFTHLFLLGRKHHVCKWLSGPVLFWCLGFYFVVFLCLACVWMVASHSFTRVV